MSRVRRVHASKHYIRLPVAHARMCLNYSCCMQLTPIWLETADESNKCARTRMTSASVAEIALYVIRWDSLNSKCARVRAKSMWCHTHTMRMVWRSDRSDQRQARTNCVDAIKSLQTPCASLCDVPSFDLNKLELMCAYVAHATMMSVRVCTNAFRYCGEHKQLFAKSGDFRLKLHQIP